MATKIEATYELTTPMFCGGVEQKAELRLASFKGLLRFWWRALAWGRLGGNLERIKDEEDQLFGSSKTGQSKVILRALRCAQQVDELPKSEVLTVSSTTRTPVGPGARYLGYGVMEAFASRNRGTKEGQLTRSCLKSPFEFTVELVVRDPLKNQENQDETVRDALIALGLFGGMGAKSRKGYGSLVLRSLRQDGQDRWRAPEEFDALADVIRTFLRGSGGGNHGSAARSPGPDYPEYTAFSPKARCLLLVAEDSRQPLVTLDRVGREMIRYRSWGRNGKIFEGIESEKNFAGDHDLMKQPAERRERHPERIAFGLPHNYGKERDQQVGPADPQLDRRASPLLTHIHRCGRTPVAVLTFLPARFLPEGSNWISVGRKRVRQQPEARLYEPIERFLDRLLDAGQRRERFSQVREV